MKSVSISKFELESHASSSVQHISQRMSVINFVCATKRFRLLQTAGEINKRADRWQLIREETSTTFANIGKFNTSDTSNQGTRIAVWCMLFVNSLITVLYFHHAR